MGRTWTEGHTLVRLGVRHDARNDRYSAASRGTTVGIPRRHVESPAYLAAVALLLL